MCARVPTGIVKSSAIAPLPEASASELQAGHKLPGETRMEMLEDKAQILLVLTRRLLAAAFVITAVALFATTGQLTI